MAISEFAKIISIHSLIIPKLQYEYFKENIDVKKSLNYSFTPIVDNIKTEEISDELIVLFPMEFYAFSIDELEKSKEKENVFIYLEVDYEIVFKKQKSNKISEQMKEELIKDLVPRIVHPYFRQTVAEVLQKVGLPTLQLPLLETAVTPED